MKKSVAVLLVLILVGPVLGLVSVAALLIPSSSSCGSGSLLVSGVPESLTAQTSDGRSITLDRTQLTHAATIIGVGGRDAAVGRSGVLVALMAALTESTLRMLANTTAYPESAAHPHDGVGSDHDSLGLFQMRPASGWGTITELMNPEYQARAFFGGPTGPNAGSPRGLLDIAGWQTLNPGTAAQTVEVSAYPDRYQNYQPVAETILTTLTQAPADPTIAAPAVHETSQIVFPLPSGTYTSTDSFGWRTDPYSGARAFHSGSDLAAPSGTSILAVADGVVSFAGQRGTYGGLITIEHTVRGELVTSYYAHMYQNGIHVAVGDHVTAGQHIGDVGSAGKSTGSHLHIEIHPGGASKPAVNAMDWLASQGASGITGALAASKTGCTPERAA